MEYATAKQVKIPKPPKGKKRIPMFGSLLSKDGMHEEAEGVWCDKNDNCMACGTKIIDG